MTTARYNVPTYGDGKIAVSIFASAGGNLMESGEQKRKPGGDALLQKLLLRRKK